MELEPLWAEGSGQPAPPAPWLSPDPGLDLLEVEGDREAASGVRKNEMATSPPQFCAVQPDRVG